MMIYYYILEDIGECEFELEVTHVNITFEEASAIIDSAGAYSWICATDEVMDDVEINHKPEPANKDLAIFARGIEADPDIVRKFNEQTTGKIIINK